MDRKVSCDWDSTVRYDDSERRTLTSALIYFMTWEVQKRKKFPLLGLDLDIRNVTDIPSYLEQTNSKSVERMSNKLRNLDQ